MIRLGTRGSPLALVQARAVAVRLRARGAEVDILPIRTEGDRLAEARLAAVGGKGLFVKEIEEALLEGRIDAAVHSLKDVPAELPSGLCLGAFPEREDPRDVLVTPAGGGLEDLRAGAVVGTSSPRRRAIVLALRPDVVVDPIRGNVDTRLGKLERGGWDAVILAAAGLQRLGLRPPHARPLPPEVFVPAVGQGILGLEVRAADDATRAVIAALDHPPTRARAVAERAFLRRLGASCATPIAGHAWLEGEVLHMAGLVASDDGRQVLRERATGTADRADALGLAVAEALLGRGAAGVVPLAPAPLAGGARR